MQPEGTHPESREDSKSTAAEVATATPRRKSAPRRKSRTPGVFSRLDAKGKPRYEYAYRDPGDGHQIWKGGFAKLKEAEDDRAETLRRIRRGERVMPVRETFAQFADTWLASQSQLRDSTRSRYKWAIERHLKRRFGSFKLGEIREDQVALLVADMTEAGYAGSTIKAVLAPLSLILGRALRRGAIASNPVDGLERSERPQGKRRDMRILERAEISQLIDSTPDQHQALVATLIFTGLRISEALALRWRDIDFDGGTVKVRWQLGKGGERVEPKTPNAIRDVVLMPTLATVLREHRLRSEWSDVDDPVFASQVGGPLNRHNFGQRVFRPAVERAGLEGGGRPTLRTHDLRHTFASLLIAGGASVVFASRQLGHASPTVTLSVYAHLFDARDHADQMSSMLEDSFGNDLSTAMRGQARSGADPEAAEVASLRPIAGERG